MKLKKQIKTEQENDNMPFYKKASIGLGCFLLIEVSVFILFFMINVFMNGDNASLGNTVSHYGLISVVSSFIIGFFVLDRYAKNISAKKPNEKNIVAKEEWRTMNEIKAFSSFKEIDTGLARTKYGGYPITAFIDADGEMKLLVETDDVHSLTVGTTFCGKTRKVVIELIMNLAKKGDNLIINDPKKELYYKLKNVLEKIFGYKVWCLDFRNFQYSDGWNPLELMNDVFYDDTLSYELKESLIDTSAKDFANVIMDLFGNTEPIWINGERSVHQSALLNVLLSNIKREYKNLSTVTQMVEINQATRIKVKGQQGTVPLYNLFLKSLPEDHPARRSGNLLLGAPGDTRDSFYSSVLATYDVFHSKPLMRVLNRSSFRYKDFDDPNKKIAIFVVNPDEKSTYDKITSVFYDQSYQALVDIANKKNNLRLSKTVHNVWDENGNMPLIDLIQKKFTVARSRGILYNLFMQDFAQMDQVYDEKIAKIVRSNCMIQTFIASTDTDTCKQISERLGNEDKLVASYSANHDTNHYTGGGISYQHQQVPLMDANELLRYDARSGKDLIMSRTYLGAMKVYLPDISQYDEWNRVIEKNTINPEMDTIRETDKNKEIIEWVIPRYVVMTNKTPFEEMRERQSGKKDDGIDPNTMVWYWSNNDDIGELVKNHLISWQNKQGHKVTNKELNEYARTKEFLDWVDKVDIEQTLKRNNMKNVKMPKQTISSMHDDVIDEFEEDLSY